MRSSFRPKNVHTSQPDWSLSVPIRGRRGWGFRDRSLHYSINFQNFSSGLFRLHQILWSSPSCFRNYFYWLPVSSVESQLQLNVYVQRYFALFFLLGGPHQSGWIMTQVPWFMYQNRLGPSGGIYYPNFVPCFVVLYLNFLRKYGYIGSRTRILTWQVCWL